MDSKSKHLKVKEDLNKVSPSFCLAKWLQVTVHLQNGNTHSCHHPGTHKIGLDELAQDPSALHNTSQKKLARKQMLEGKRPSECDYCWNVEDSHPDNLSDRVFKSGEEWSMTRLEEIAARPWDYPVNPTNLEVSFGNECNFKCAYCSPQISSAIMTEYKTHGPYPGMAPFGLDKLKERGLYPFGKDEANPYVDAFWKWWPSVSKDLKVFRITGGEPLLNQNTFQFLKTVQENPLPNLVLAINTNLGVPDVTFKKFLKEIKIIVEKGLVKEFQLYTSVDTFGKNAEFVRFGLDYEQFMKNVKTFLTEIPEAQLIFMSTYNAFSPINFDKLLLEVSELKRNFRTKTGDTRVILDLPYLNNPVILSCLILTPDFHQYFERDLTYLKSNTDIYTDKEIEKLERIYNWFRGYKENFYRRALRKVFFNFIEEYTLRKNIKFLDYCPEYLELYEHCKALFNEGKKP